MPGIEWMNYKEFHNLYLVETIDLGDVYGMNYSSLETQFRDFANLKSISVNQCDLAENPFTGCTDLEKVTFHKDSTMGGIPINAFAGCTNLKEVWFGKKTGIMGDLGIENEDVIFFVYAGSEAEAYAVKNGIEYVVIS